MIKCVSKLSCLNMHLHIYGVHVSSLCFRYLLCPSVLFLSCILISNPYFPFDVVMSQIKAMAEDIQPLLAEVRNTGLLKEVEDLTRSLTQASEDLRLISKSLLLLFSSSLACMHACTLPCSKLLIL